MKQISTFQLAVAFVGVFLGAGFVSGQELWQFFACFGPVGLLGFVLSVLLFVLVDYALLRLARNMGSGDVGALIFPGNHPRLRACVGGMQGLLLFGIVVIMIAGAAALLRDLLGLPLGLCGGLFTAAVFAAAMFELRGVVTAFSILVPITAATAVVLGVAVLFRQAFRFEPAVGSAAVLLPNWWISGITYAAYNLFGTIGILAPFAALVPDRKTIGRGLGLGTGLLLALTFCILAAMIAVPACGQAELPAAMLAGQVHPALGVAYNLLMGLGMFSAALSSLLALLDQTSFHWPVFRTRRKTFLCVFLAAACGLSLLGFGNLIGVIYPVFGYISIPLLALLVRNWWKQRLPKA